MGLPSSDKMWGEVQAVPHGLVDWLIAAYLLLGVIAGARRGFLASALTIVCAAAAVALGYVLASPLVAYADRSFQAVSRAASAISGHLPLPEGLAAQPLSQSSLAALLQWLESVPWPDALRSRLESAIQDAAVAAMTGSATTVGDFAYHLAARPVLAVLAFAAVYLVASGVLRLVLAATIEGAGARSWLGGLDRLAGALFGFATSGVTAAALLSALMGISVLAPAGWLAPVASSAWASYLVGVLEQLTHAALARYAS